MARWASSRLEDIGNNGEPVESGSELDGLAACSTSGMRGSVHSGADPYPAVVRARGPCARNRAEIMGKLANPDLGWLGLVRLD